MRRAALALLALVLSCSSRDERARDGGLDAANAAAPTARTTPREPGFRVRGLRGSVVGTSSLPEEIPRDYALELLADSTLTLALADYAVVRLHGPALVTLMPEGEPALYLRQGLVSIDSAPRAARVAARPLWVATPAARVEVVESARLVVRAHPDFSSELVVVSGDASVTHGEEPLLLAAGDMRCLSRPAAKSPRRRLPTLEEAERVLGTSKSCPAKPRDDRAVRERALDAACDAIEQAEERERMLLAMHAGLATARDVRAQSVQAQLARIGALRVRQRERVRALRAQLAAALLGATPTPIEAALLTRARALAPYTD